MMKTIPVNEVSILKMVAGNEKRFRAVIDDGILKEWIGFGWIENREATPEDYKKYAVVVRDDDD